jgi:hypothetical protein
MAKAAGFSLFPVLPARAGFTEACSESRIVAPGVIEISQRECGEI